MRLSTLTPVLAMALAMPALAVEPTPPGLKSHARAVEQVPPIYPVGARREGVEGEVVAWAYVDAEGSLTKVRIRKSPHELLSDAVESALTKWRFTPAVRDGKPTESVNEYAFRFHLSEPDAQMKLAMPAPDADTVSRFVASMEGAEAFRSKYWKAGSHKAFASAESGAWGWAGGRSSVEQAVQAALETCERARDRLTSACRIVDIDGNWQPLTARALTSLSKLTPFEMALHRRAAVQEWPEPRKAKALTLLDDCRTEADAFLRTLKTQDAAAIYQAVAEEMRAQYSLADFEQVLGSIRSLAGLVTHTTFKDQSLVTRKGDEELRLDQATVVTYLANSVSQPAGVLLMLTLAPERGHCRVTGFQYFAPGAMPPWMQDDAGRRERGT